MPSSGLTANTNHQSKIAPLPAHRPELVTLAHLDRKALIYVRQSTMHQVLSNQESLRLQYALEQRALGLGWRADDIEVIDADLGLTGATASHRSGFQELVTKVTLGQVGIILSCEVTRLSRNCSDWYPLLDVCGYKDCLIADNDGIYDPASANGRLLLGLKGQLSELELHTIRGRLTAGLLNKAARGALALQLPVGLVRDALGRVQQDPNRAVQDQIALVFTTFLRLKTASKVLQFFNAPDLCLPRRDRFGDVVWKKPTVAAILAMLKNPAYGGALVYGRTRSVRTGPSAAEVKQVRLPQEQWRIRVNAVYPAYVPWETFQQTQAILLDNYAEYDRNKTRGIPRPGAALLHGIVYCGECGHKLVVQYKGGTRYLCTYLRQQYGVPICQRIPADAVDTHVIEAFFQALAPVELDAYAQAVARYQALNDQLDHARCQQLERVRYEAALAERHFLRVDPDNRLVAAELEKRWEAALAELKRTEDAAAQPPSEPQRLLPLSAEMERAFRTIGQRLPELWRQGVIGQIHKKALLRCLIDKVVVHRTARDQVHARIVWKGGATSTLTIPVAVGSLADLSGAQAMERFILKQSLAGATDEEMADALTAQGHRSPLRPVVLPSTVKCIRLRHSIFQKRSQSHPRHISGALTVSQLATRLEVPAHWVYDRIYNRRIQMTKDAATGLFLFPDHPTTLAQLRDLKNGTLKHVRFAQEHQDA
jgi:DNA invertase Pin-like site-specific DNA recombinase